MAEIHSEQPPDKVNKGPFHVFAMIDGHRGETVAKFIHEHLMDVILRNENIMCNKYYVMGLKQVFVKLDEVLSTPSAKKRLNDMLGYPEAKKGTIFQKPEDPDAAANAESIPWSCGASMTILIINTNQVHIAHVGDCRATMCTVKGQGKFTTHHMDLNRDHKAGRGL